MLAKKKIQKKKIESYLKKFPFINFEKPLYNSKFVGKKEGKEDGICH
jgi:hypothetical protein